MDPSRRRAARCIDLVVPVKGLDRAKSRLRGARSPVAHAALALALAHDTVAAARGAAAVGRLVVVSSDPVVTAEFTAIGVDVVPDGPRPGLNAAYRHGVTLLGSAGPVAALNADLPALRPAELDAALAAADAAFTAGRATSAFCADAEGTGTTLLVVAASALFEPRFGERSAQRHAAAGALPLDGEWPGLRRDVDTSDDLRAAAALGLGPRTRRLLEPTRGCC